MHAYMPYLWLGVVLCAAIAEAIGRRMIALWMIPGGVVASVLAFVRLPIWVQVLTFIVVSTLCCFLFFRPATRQNGRGRRNKGAEDLIGKTGRVIETIDNLAGCGLVSIDDEEWAARSVDYEVILDKGSVVAVVAVEGVRLICREV